MNEKTIVFFPFTSLLFLPSALVEWKRKCFHSFHFLFFQFSITSFLHFSWAKSYQPANPLANEKGKRLNYLLCIQVNLVSSHWNICWFLIIFYVCLFIVWNFFYLWLAFSFLELFLQILFYILFCHSLATDTTGSHWWSMVLAIFT